MKTRIHFLDEYRGLALLAMLLYHTWYDMASIFGCDMPWFYSYPTHIFQQWIGMSFVFVSGMCCMLSKSNLKRGLVTFGAAMAMTVITYLVIPSELILFGVLHLLGLCSIIAAAIIPLVKKLSRRSCVVGALMCLALFIILYGVPHGFVGVFSHPIVFLSKSLYSSPLLFWLGLPSRGFYSADYYPLIPWFMLFMTGAFTSTALKDNFPQFMTKSHIPPLAKIGKHTLIIYLLHQPVIYGALYLIFSFK